jgi:peroxiredoxin
VRARALALALTCTSRASAARAAPPADPVQRVLAGLRQAPAFQVRTLEGRTLDLAALTARGPLVIDFWATWCKPCVASLPALQALHERLAPRGVTVLGVSIDGPRNYSRVRPFVNKLGLTYPVAIDEDGTLAERFQVVGVPTTVVIGPDRRIALTRTGYSGDAYRDVEAAVRALLPADSAAVPADPGRAR